MTFPHEEPDAKPQKPQPKEAEKPPQLDSDQKSAAMKALPARITKCFLCKWILQDLVQHGNLTGHPKTEFAGVIFPEKAKLRHLQLEGILS